VANPLGRFCVKRDIIHSSNVLQWCITSFSKHLQWIKCLSDFQTNLEIHPDVKTAEPQYVYPKYNIHMVQVGWTFGFNLSNAEVWEGGGWGLSCKYTGPVNICQSACVGCILALCVFLMFSVYMCVSGRKEVNWGFWTHARPLRIPGLQFALD